MLSLAAALDDGSINLNYHSLKALCQQPHILRLFSLSSLSHSIERQSTSPTDIGPDEQGKPMQSDSLQLPAGDNCEARPMFDFICSVC